MVRLGVMPSPTYTSTYPHPFIASTSYLVRVIARDEVDKAGANVFGGFFRKYDEEYVKACEEELNRRTRSSGSGGTGHGNPE